MSKLEREKKLFLNPSCLEEFNLIMLYKELETQIAHHKF